MSINASASTANRPVNVDLTLDDALFAETDKSLLNSSSEYYYAQMDNLFPESGRARAKAFGQFFTPNYVSAPMIESIVDSLEVDPPTVLSVIDPFCGDGRLVVDFLTSLAGKDWASATEINLSIWDIDKRVLSQAEENILKAVSELALHCTVSASCQDAFSEALVKEGMFDVCITNPPWSSTKSLKKSFFDREEEYCRYKAVCESYAQMLDKIYEDVNDAKHSRIVDTNISRFGLSASLRLIRRNGICGIVMPESFLSDSTSRTLRKYLFTETNVHRIDYFSASLKPFKGADQGCVSCVMSSCEKSTNIQVQSHYENDKEVKAYIDATSLEHLAKIGYSIPLGYTTEQIQILFKLANNRELGLMPGICIRKEKDETRITDILKSKGDFTFIKGYMVNCFSMKTEGTFLSYSDFKKVPDSVYMPKIVWRDISRASQKKRVKATLVPKLYVAGNSLGVIYSKNNEENMYVLLAIINSYVFEFMINAKLANNHVSLEAMKKTGVPYVNPVDSTWITSIVSELLANESQSIEKIALLNARIGHCYGLTLENYLLVLDKFDFDKDDYRCFLLAAKKEWEECR